MADAKLYGQLAQGTALGKFWLPDHDSTAREAVIEREFGDTVDMLHALGYGPGRRNALTGEEPPPRL